MKDINYSFQRLHLMYANITIAAIWQKQELIRKHFSTLWDIQKLV